MMETTVSEDGSTRFMTIRVTPEQEAAMEAFFQINNWALIKEAEKEKAEQEGQVEGGEGAESTTTCIIKDQDGQEIQVQQVQEVVVNDINDPALEEFATVQEVQVSSQEATNLPQIITVYSNPSGQGQGIPQMIMQQDDGQPLPQVIIQEITLPNQDSTVKRVTLNQAITNTVPQTITRRVVPRGSVKPGDKVHKCHVCGKTFKQSPSFNGHYQSHFGAKPFNCEICNTGFTLKAALVAHMSIHTGNKPYQCTTCGKSFRRKDDMLSHVRTHTGEKPYECEICGKKFKYRNQIPKHKRMHTGERPYHCTHCEKAFSSNIHLIRHERTHTGERPFKCNICNKAFTQYGHLQAHTRIHSDERPFTCSICGRGFREKKVLKKHEAIHTMDKPFKCEVCGKGFLRQSNMELHAVMHSKGEDGTPRQRPRPKKKSERVTEADEEMREFVENVLSSVVKVEAGIQTESIEVPVASDDQVITGSKEDIDIQTSESNKVEATDNLAAFVNFAVESQELEQQKAISQVPTVASEILEESVKKIEGIETVGDGSEQYTLVMQEDGSEGYLITVDHGSDSQIVTESQVITTEQLEAGVPVDQIASIQQGVVMEENQFEPSEDHEMVEVQEDEVAVSSIPVSDVMPTLSEIKTEEVEKEDTSGLIVAGIIENA